MNVEVVCDGEDSSATIVMKQVVKWSRHKLTILQWTPKLYDETDLVYYHYGGLFSYKNKTALDFLDRKQIPCIAGLRGLLNLKRWVNEWPPLTFCDFVSKFDGISCANIEFSSIVKKLDSSIPTFVCHSGVDTEMFKPSSLPKHFCIGWAGNPYSGAKNFSNFIKLPFVKRTAGIDIGTARAFSAMPDFYKDISVYVSTSVEEGSPVPPKEAAASGKPVVAINVGDLGEWVPFEFLVDDLTQLSNTIQILKVDKDLLEREAIRFRKLSIRWDYSIVAQEYDEMFEKIA